MDPGPGTAMRQAAVAGAFYPSDGDALKAEVAALLAAAPAAAGTAAPKAVIVPHAGYAYSGPVAAAAFGAVTPLKGTVHRVVLIGPSHFVTFTGIAAPMVEAFATPLGAVPLDWDAIDLLVERNLAVIDDRPHRDEHALEVQLPFLMAALGSFVVVPLVVGTALASAVASVLDALWGGPETLMVVSSDLSHYHDRETARVLDAATAAAIEGLDGTYLTGEDACGHQAVAGLLLAARRHGLAARRLDLRNSGDTAGSPDRVVGYGAWSLAQAPE